MNIEEAKSRIFINIVDPYNKMINDIDVVMETYRSVLPACMFYKYSEKWNRLAESTSRFFANDLVAKRVFEDIEEIPFRDVFIFKMLSTNMRMKKCKIGACKTFCEECILRSFSNEQCQKFFEDILL